MLTDCNFPSIPVASLQMLRAKGKSFQCGKTGAAIMWTALFKGFWHYCCKILSELERNKCSHWHRCDVLAPPPAVAHILHWQIHSAPSIWKIYFQIPFVLWAKCLRLDAATTIQLFPVYSYRCWGNLQHGMEILSSKSVNVLLCCRFSPTCFSSAWWLTCGENKIHAVMLHVL